jgi:hypothetical protein
MNFGNWYLARTAGGGAEASGTLHPLGVCELHRRLGSGEGPPAVVVDAGDMCRGLFDFSTFFGVLNRVRNAGGYVVVVDREGSLAGFFFGVGLSAPVPVVRSLGTAWELVGALARRAMPLAADELPGSAGREPAKAPASPEATVAGPSGGKRRHGLKDPVLHLSAWRSRRRAAVGAGLARSA